MKRSHKIILNTVLLILSALVFWICNYYPRHILEWSSAWSIVAILLNILYFVLYDYILVVIFKKGLVPFFEDNLNYFEPVVKRFYIKEIAVLFGIQLLFEVLNSILARLLGAWSFLSTDLLVILQWFAVFAYLTKDNGIKYRVRKILGAVASFAVLVGIVVIFDVIMALDFIANEEKYQPSFVILQIIGNYDFANSIKLLLLDLVISIIFVAFLFSSYKSENEGDKRLSKTSLCLRVCVLIFAAFVACAAKMLIYPDSSVSTIDIDTLNLKNYQENGQLDTVEKTFSLNRKNGRSNENICLLYHTTKIQEGDMSPLKITRKNFEIGYIIGDEGPSSPNGNNDIAVESPHNEFEFDGNKIYLYRDKAVCFYENGIPRAVKFEDLDTLEKNDTVIKLCEKLLSNGNLFVFEYAYDYLLEYDRSYIEPYIQRYSVGDFTSQELDWLNRSYYRSEYIVNIAIRLDQ